MSQFTTAMRYLLLYCCSLLVVTGYYPTYLPGYLIQTHNALPHYSTMHPIHTIYYALDFSNRLVML